MSVSRTERGGGPPPRSQPTVDLPAIRDPDLRLLCEIMALSRPDELGLSATEATYRVLETLERLLGSDFASFQAQQTDLPFRRRVEVVYAQVEEQGEHVLLDRAALGTLDPHPASEIMARYWWDLPCSLSDRTGLPQVSTLRTHFGQREWAVHPTNAGCLDVDDEMVLAHPRPDGSSLRVLLGRHRGRPFGPRELALAQLILPHLPPLLAAAAAEHEFAALPAPVRQPLTERQKEILRLVAQGLPNRRVAHLLHISEATVRKHLENAYARLGVQSRTEAAHLLHTQESSPTG